jgi:NADH:ubiquinone oxidoreductase subunit 6 (subunit J)
MDFVIFLIDGMMMMKFFNFDEQNVKALAKIIKASNNKRWMGINLFGQYTNCLHVANECNWQIIYF